MQTVASTKSAPYFTVKCMPTLAACRAGPGSGGHQQRMLPAQPLGIWLLASQLSGRTSCTTAQLLAYSKGGGYDTLPTDFHKPCSQRQARLC
jgi:hypothetical protein